MEDIVFIKRNKYWQENHKPLVTVITSNYNRREILLRCMRSVDAQTFRDLEYIVVDNGSSVSFDDIMEQFMEEATIPVMFIKRSNGIGRHTGRNSAIREARGEYLSMIDSDDEYLPDGIEKLVNAWMQIPEGERKDYREVVGLCQDEKGNLVGKPFPENINKLSKKEAQTICFRPEYCCEHANMNRTILLKENLFPEPEGVSNYTDSIIWWKLAKNHKSFFLNDKLKVYYTDSTDSITNTNKVSSPASSMIGLLWTDLYYLNHWGEFDFPFRERVRRMFLYIVEKSILKAHNKFPCFGWSKQGLLGGGNKIMYVILYIPSVMMIPVMKKRHGDISD